jgi:hypothetical protein
MSFRARRSRIFMWIFGLCLAAAISICGTARCEPETSTVDPELLKLIPEELVYHRKPLADDKNAFGPLQEAWKHVLPIARFQRELGGKVNLRALCNLDETYRDPEIGRQLEALLDKNRRALELMDEAIARGRLQFPPRPNGRGDRNANKLGDPATLCRDLVDLRCLRSRWYFEHKEYVKSAEELQAVVRFGGILDGSDGAGLPRLSGRVFPILAALHMETLAHRKEVPTEVVAGMLVALEQAAPSEEVVIEGVRQDFALVVLPMLADIPKDGELAKAVAAIIDKRWPRNADVKLTSPKLEGKLAALQAGILDLLKDHPEPYDWADAIRLVALSAGNEIQTLKHPWAHRKPDPTATVSAEVAAWPAPLSVSFLRMVPLYLGRDDDEPLSSENLAEAREQLRKVRNPLGKHLIQDMLIGNEPSLSATRFRDRAQLEAARCIVAIYLYERKVGARPERLDDLVKAKILPEVPRDPFDGKPLRYSRERAIIWSVGRDGKDNGGRKPARGEGDALLDLLRPSGAPKLPKPAKADAESDIVWEIPPTK